MFKQITHYFCSQSLEKHRAKTQGLINQYERDKAAAEARIQAKAEKYKCKLQAHQQKREQDLQEYMAFMNEHLSGTEKLVPQLKLFQKMIFQCLETWTQLSLIDKRYELEEDKMRLNWSNRIFLDALKLELTRLSRQPESQAWRVFIAERPVRVSIDLVDGFIKKAEKDMKNESSDFDLEIRRIKSQKSALANAFIKMRAEQSMILNEQLKPLREKLQNQKRELREQYMAWRDDWVEMAQKFDNFYQYKPSENPLANEWINEMEEGGTLFDILAIIKSSKNYVDEARESKNSLQDQMNTAKSRVDSAYKNKEYSTIDHEKRLKDQIYRELTSARSRFIALSEARKVFFNRRTEIEGYKKKIWPFHPDNNIERVYELFSEDEPSTYWQAIGLKTRTIQNPDLVRKNHASA